MLRLCLWTLFIVLTVAETGLDGWLRYARVPNAQDIATRLPSSIVALDASHGSPVHTAALELQHGIAGIVGKTLEISNDCEPASSALVVGTIDKYREICRVQNILVDDRGQDFASTQHALAATGDLDLVLDGFAINVIDVSVTILALNERGVLYGVFNYLSQLAQGDLSKESFISNPDAPLRWTNEWDNLDGSIERGYGGVSIFFTNGTILEDLTRASLYARLVSSVGINAVVVNNVNSNAEIFSARNIEGLGRIADVFRPYGVQLGVAAKFDAPKTLGGLSTYDPLDADVIAWWKDITEQIYIRMPDFAGYLVKANSEGQPGPLTYNRTFADGANMFAKPLKPHGGVVMFRAFVWDDLDYDDWKADRANTAVEYFHPLDGKFDDNVVVQIKHGPIDFQVREPVHPLFANLRDTNVAIEVQPSPEYLGQNCHYVYLAPMWKEVYDFDLRVDNSTSLVRDIVSGKHFGRPLGGYAGVTGVGSNMTWLGHHLSMSNLYAFGRLAWSPTLGSEDILAEWTRLTFGLDEHVLQVISKISMQSWPAYENYTGPLGIQTLTDILYTHFGPGVATMDANSWGFWTRSDQNSIGVDRTSWNGSGNTALYPFEIAQMYENIDQTPEALLLWFHHVNYTHKLSSRKTVIQHMYDTHYNGAETAQSFVTQWETLKDKIDDERYEEVLFRLHFQAGHSIVWRDAVNGYFRNLSGIPDEKNRVWNHPYRIEAESMHLDGYKTYTVYPYETASNATAIVTSSNTTTGTATASLNFPDGTYTLAINFFDLYGGASDYSVSINEKLVGQWTEDWIDGGIKLGHEQSRYLDSHSATRIALGKVNIKRGDLLTITGVPDGIEPAPLDYVVFGPEGVVD